MTEFWYNQSADLTLSTPSLGVDSFLEGSFTKQIHITAAVPVAYLLVVEQADVVLDVFVEHPGASLQLYAICFSATPEARTIRVVTHMQGSQTHAQVHLLSFLYDNTALQVHGDMLIAPSTQ